MSQYKKRITLKDVAQVAGVSEMTVSRVMRGTDTVSKRTQKKVLAIIDDLGYVQNRMAGALANARSNQVAVLIPSLSNQVFNEVMSGISEELDREGYQAVVGITNYSLEKEEELIYSMMSWRPAGIIVTNTHHTKRARNVLLNAGVPVVEMMNITDRPIDMCVGFDHGEAGRALALHLLKRGYHRFGYVGWNERDFAAATRFDAIEAELKKAGCSIVAPNQFERPPNLATGKLGLANLLALSPDIDAVYFSNDTAAMGGLMHCLQHDISVPKSLAIAGFTGLESSQHLPLRLTTIQTNRYQIGRLSARGVLARLANRQPKKVLDLKFELVEGETS
ncbi:MAG: LacI family DNA-binding transcriptional regulator [Hyphomicrobiales bacterium]